MSELPYTSRTGIDVRPVAVAYVTATWQDAREFAEAAVTEMIEEALVAGENTFAVTLDLLDAMAEMPIIIIEGYAHAVEADCQEWIAQALAAFGQEAAE